MEELRQLKVYWLNFKFDLGILDVFMRENLSIQVLLLYCDIS